MIYPLCDIAGRNRATGKPIVSTCVMDMQVQLLRYFRDYGLDDDPDWRESLEVILEVSTRRRLLSSEQRSRYAQ
mgnify:CR=1 FL=1